MNKRTLHKPSLIFFLWTQVEDGMDELQNKTTCKKVFTNLRYFHCFGENRVSAQRLHGQLTYPLLHTVGVVTPLVVCRQHLL